jgi:uncharacterized protein
MPRRPALIAVSMFATLLLNTHAVAQPAPTDPAAAARELVVTMRTADQLKNLMPIFMQQLKPLIARGRPDVDQAIDALVPTLMEGMLARSDEFVDLVAAVYARNFTAEELRQVTAFYRGPVGGKLLEKMPTITQESMLAGQKWGQAVAGELQTRIVEELRKRGVNP